MTLLQQVFVSRCCWAVGTCDQEIDFDHLNFTLYSILGKHLYCFTFSHGLSAEQNVRGLSFEKTTMPAQLNVSPVPGYRTAFWLHSAKGHQWVKQLYCCYG